MENLGLKDFNSLNHRLCGYVQHLDRNEMLKTLDSRHCVQVFFVPKYLLMVKPPTLLHQYMHTAVHVLKLLAC